jgi:uncharacterized protein (DUF362 family)
MHARRAVLKGALLAAAAQRGARAAGKLEMPGPYRGKVVSVEHPGSIVSGQYQAEPVGDMVRKGMTELTGAPGWLDAWRVFFEKGDVVGIKLNPVGRPHVISSPEVVREIIAALNAVGIPNRDIVCYDRYRREFLEAGFEKWLPEGVRWTAATDKTHPLQLDMDGYDADQFVEMALVLPKANAADPHHRRSYLAKFISKDVNKMVNLCLLKHHQSAGITIALKNMSHGLVNNVSRSHSSSTLNTCGTFIPAIVDHRIIRQKCVLHILDGIKAGYHGGPGGKIGKYTWEHKTMYFASDPVAIDRIGWKALDEKRVAAGRQPVALARPDEDSRFLNMQPEHVEIAGAMGMGEFDEKNINWVKLRI